MVMKKLMGILLAILVLFSCSACSNVPSADLVYDAANAGYNVHAFPEGVNANARNIILDNKFTQGFEMHGNVNNSGSDWIYGKYMTYGNTVDVSKNKWKLAEWCSKSTLANASGNNYSYTKNGNLHTYKDNYKLVAVNPVDGTLTLGVNGIAEYNNAERPLAGTGTNNWVHLLAAYSCSATNLAAFTDCKVYIDFKIDSCVQSTAFTPKVPGEQAAQFVFYFTLWNNLIRKYTWFGVPLYDSREENDPFVYGELFQWDIYTETGIYNVPKDEYFETQPVVGTRYKKLIDIDDSLQFVTERLIKEGAWPSNTTKKDIILTFSNMGWEVPGTINCQATIYGLGTYIN